MFDSENNKATILVVDDEPVIRELIKAQLAVLGYNPLTACSGHDAILKSKNFNQLDVLLTDILMPCMNGIELVDKFKKLFPETKIILMSGYMTPPPGISDYPTGKYPFLKKPFNLEQLNSEIQKVLTH